jgi:exosortase H (IPTLxxWG-CTERM-specific)
LNPKKKKKEAIKPEYHLINTWSNKKPVLLFVGFFTFFIALFYIAWTSSFGSTHIFEPIVSFYAAASGKILALLGYDISVKGTMICSSGLDLNIKRGCDAIEATALFAAAILAFPVPFRRKIVGLIVGIVTLILVNFIRIITLYIAGHRYPALFNFLHDQIWQVIYIAIAVLLLLLWLQSLRHREG